MTSISLESDIRRRPIIPTHLISAFLEQATAHGSRSTALRLVAGLLLISVAGTVVAAYVKTPFWIVTLFTVFAAFAASLHLTTYVYTLFENERGAASKTAWTPRFSADCDNFDILGLKNAARHWFARDLMTSLGYEDWRSFTNAIHRAMGTCTTLNIPVSHNFARIKRQIDGLECDDYELSRLACCLIALNGDTYKPRVAAAQAYFISSER